MQMMVNILRMFNSFYPSNSLAPVVIYRHFRWFSMHRKLCGRFYLILVVNNSAWYSTEFSFCMRYDLRLNASYSEKSDNLGVGHAMTNSHLYRINPTLHSFRVELEQLRKKTMKKKQRQST